TDARGSVTASANLPNEILESNARIAQYARELARENKPVVEPGVGTVYFGNTRLVEGLRIIPALQALLIAMFLTAGIYALRTRGRADREQIWAGMSWSAWRLTFARACQRSQRLLPYDQCVAASRSLWMAIRFCSNGRSNR